MHKSVVMATSVGSLSVVLQHYGTQCSKQSPVQNRSMKLQYAMSHWRYGGRKWIWE